MKITILDSMLVFNLADEEKYEPILEGARVKWYVKRNYIYVSGAKNVLYDILAKLAETYDIDLA